MYTFIYLYIPIKQTLLCRVILVDLVKGQFLYIKFCKIPVISFVFRLKVVSQYVHSIYLTYQH